MLWRLLRKDFEAGMGASNRAAMRRIFEDDAPPGVIAWRDGRPVGWLQAAPRSAFPRLATSRVSAPVDDLPVWSVSCFVVRKEARGTGVGVALLGGACDLARAAGTPALEGYPVEPTKRPYPPVYAFTGFAESYRRAGFEEVARRSPTRPIFRRWLDAAKATAP